MINEKIERVDGTSGLKVINFETSDVSKDGVLIIPTDVLVIGKNASEEIKHVVKFIKFNNKLEAINEGAFQGCDLLKKINLSDSTKFIGEKAFFRCGKLQEINVCAVNIERYAFCGCRNLKTLSLGNKIKKIGDYCFAKTGITTLCLPHTLRSLGMGAFMDCRNLVNLTIGGDIGQISLSSFEGCSALQSVVLTVKLEKIQTRAFKNCSALKNIHLVKQNNIKVTVTAFEGCKNLSYVQKTNEEYVLPETELIYSILSQTDTE